MHPELVVSGWQHPHPQYYCPVCGESYWVVAYDDNKPVLKREPDMTKWGTRSREHYHKTYNYTWRANKHE